MPRIGFEPGSPRSKSKHPTIGLTMLYIKIDAIFSFINDLSTKFGNSNTFQKTPIKPFLIILKAKVDFYKVKAIQKTFFEGRPLVITP